MTDPQKISIGAREDIFLIGDFLSREECAQFIAMSEAQGYDGATIATAKGQRVANDIRNNDRLIWDDQELARNWWLRVVSFIPPAFGRWRAHGFNERFRFYRYAPGQKFVQHRDGSFERSPSEMSWMTFIVYLNEGFDGGRTRFDLAGEPVPIEIVPATGTALVFMHDRLHEGEEVRTGVKYVLRTDIMYLRS
jgi:hypothetical protein